MTYADVLLTSLIFIGLIVVVGALGMAVGDRVRFRCRHDWDIRQVSPPMFDIMAKGILKTCRRCGKVVAK